MAVFIWHFGYPQIPDILSYRHKDKIERVSSARKKLKKYRKYYSQDSTKEIKRIEKLWKTKFDSLATSEIPGGHAQQDTSRYKNEILSKLPGKEVFYKRYEKLQQEFSRPDTTSIGMADSLKNLSFEEYYTAERERYLEENGYTNMSLDSLGQAYHQDSLSSYARAYSQQRIDLLKKESESHMNQMARDAGLGLVDENAAEFNKAKNIPKNYQEKYGQYSNLDSLKMASVEKGREFLTGNPVAVAAAQDKITKMKKKYSSVLNSNDLSTATKANSMTGRPLTDRIFLGGNFQFSHTEPFTIFFDPVIGYKINKRLVAGVGTRFQFSFGEYDTLANNYNKKKSELSYKVFTNYDIFRNFYLTTEFENNKILLSQTDKGASYTWTPSLFAGIGKSFSISYGFNGYISVVYDFLHNPAQSVYSSPFAVRFGLGLPGLRGLGVK